MTDIERLIDQFLAYIDVERGLAKATVRAYDSDLRKYNGWLAAGVIRRVFVYAEGWCGMAENSATRRKLRDCAVSRIFMHACGILRARFYLRLFICGLRLFCHIFISSPVTVAGTIPFTMPHP